MRTPSAARTLCVALLGCALGTSACGDDDAADVVAHDASTPPMPNVGAQATAMLESVMTDDDTASEAGVAAPTDGGHPVYVQTPITGAVTFTETTEGVDLLLEFRTCVPFKFYPLRILDTDDCGKAIMGDASIWGDGRSADLPDGSCVATSGGRRVAYSRARANPAAWSIGDGGASDVVGRAFVLYDPDDGDKVVACGVIQRTPGTPADAGIEDAGPLPSLEVRAQLAAWCLGQAPGRTATDECPNRESLVECANVHCGLDDCTRKCAEHTACLEGFDNVCASSCPPTTQECTTCVTKLTSCTLNFCSALFTCADPTMPGGECDQLTDCCKLQGERARACLDGVAHIAELAGDLGCRAARMDWSVMTEVIFDPVCEFRD